MKKIFFLFICLLTLGFGLSACNDNNEPDDPVKDVFTPVSIETILSTGKNNQKFDVEGTVYAVVEEGLFVADSATGKIYVDKPDNVTTEFKLGDKVKLRGELGLSDSLVQIKSVKEITVASSNNALPISAVEKEIVDIKNLDATKFNESFASYVKLVGTINKAGEKFYTISDIEGNSVEFDSNSNLTELDNFVGKRVTLNVIAYRYNSMMGTWSLTYAGTADEIVEAPFTFEDVLSLASKDLASVLDNKIYGKLNLPDEHSTIPSIKYNWSVEENEYITIKDNTAEIEISEVDHEVTLSVEIVYGEEKETVTYPVTLNAVVEQSVESLINEAPTIDRSYVIVRGIVVSKARNQSASTHTIIIKDLETSATIGVDFSDKDDIEALQIGSQVVVSGQYRTAAANRPNIVSVSDLKVEEGLTEFSYDFDSAYVLNSEESYEYLANNLDDFSAKLVKFENPFVNYSTSTKPLDTNWVRLGYNIKTPSGKYGDSGRSFAFLIVSANNNLGGDAWHTYYDIPYINMDGLQLPVSIYAYCLYISDDYVAFIIPSEECFVAEPTAEVSIALRNNTPAAVEAGTMTLYNETVYTDGGITWSSSNSELINVSTGEVADINESQNVTLTASYAINGVQYHEEFTVTVLGNAPISVSELLANGVDNSNVKISGIVVGFASDGNTHDPRKGIIVMDPETGEMVQVNNFTTGTYPDYYDINEILIQIGDVVEVKGTYLLNTEKISSGPDQTGRKNIQVSSVKITGSVDEINYHEENAIVVDSEAEMLAVVSDGVKFGQLIKLTGEFIVTGSGTSNGLSGSNFKIAIKDSVPTTDVSNNMKFNGYTFSLKQSNLDPIYSSGENTGWQEDLFGLTSAYAASVVFEYTGTLYLVITHQTSTYYQCTLVNYDACYTVEAITGAIDNATQLSVEAGTIELLTDHVKTDAGISWTSSDESIINLTTGVVAEVSDNTEVTLTASFATNGVSHDYEIVVTVLGSKAISVHDLVTSAENESGVKVSGVVVGFGSHGNTTYAGQKSIILMDNTTGEMVQINGGQGSDGEALAGTWPAVTDASGKEIKIGDELEVQGTYYTDTVKCGGSSYQTQTGRKQIVAVSMVVLQSDVTINWNDDNAIVVETNEQMNALVSDGVKFGQLIKLTGSFFIGGSSSTLTSCNFKLAAEQPAANDSGSYSDGFLYNDATFSIKQPNLSGIYGDNWVEDLFGLTSGMGGKVCYEYTGTLYLVITHHTSTYYQCTLVNYENCTATAVSAE